MFSCKFKQDYNFAFEIILYFIYSHKIIEGFLLAISVMFRNYYKFEKLSNVIFSGMIFSLFSAVFLGVTSVHRLLRSQPANWGSTLEIG